MTKQVNFKHISVYKGPEESPGFLLWHVSTQWRSAIENVLKPLDLTHPQFVVLATIGWLTREGAIISQADISRIAGLDPNTISQIVRGLEAKKLIERTQKRDERSKNPILTDEGSKKLKIALPAVEQADTKFFSVLTHKELNALINIFQKLMAT
jgi:DNA-binding MarR family transcriptional regulator